MVLNCRPNCAKLANFEDL